jgi:hypothetical protein
MSGNRRNMWIGRVHFHREVARLLAADKGKSDEYGEIVTRNKQLLSTVTTRLELAYGNPLRGIVSALNTMWINRDFFGTTRDSMYWIKERLLNRIK